MRIKTSRTQEHRQNILTGEWVIVSATRGDRPNNFETATRDLSSGSFFNPLQAIVEERASNEKVNLVIRNTRGEGVVYNVDNKFPVVSLDFPSEAYTKGPYQGYSGYGKHELFVYRDSMVQVKDFSVKKMEYMFEAFQKRSLELMSIRSIRSIFIFHNHGKQAGSSLLHPHSQLVASPVIPDGIERMIQGSKRYFMRHKHSVFSTIIDYERSSKERLVLENDDFIAYCPYASSMAFEIQIIPKEHQPQFAFISPATRKSLARIYKHTLQKITKTLGEVDYNMYLYTAPCDGKGYEYFRWFIRITPRLSIWGGYESGADMDVCSVFPEDAAQMLRTT